jgi:hypothetical protein
MLPLPIGQNAGRDGSDRRITPVSSNLSSATVVLLPSSITVYILVHCKFVVKNPIIRATSN